MRHDKPERPESDPLMGNTQYFGEESPASQGYSHATNVAKKPSVQPKSLEPAMVKERGLMANTRYFS